MQLGSVSPEGVVLRVDIGGPSRDAFKKFDRDLRDLKVEGNSRPGCRRAS